MKFKSPPSCYFGRIAQLAERSAVNRVVIGSSPVVSATLLFGEIYMKGRFYLKVITKKEIQKLLDAGILRNSKYGYVNKKGSQVGYYRTAGAAHKRYIQDWYADKAKTL